ncbi:MAG: NTP transferase domain-containing protein [Chloroflexota bacterium]
MDAVIIAGGIPKPGELLYDETQGSHKAMLDMCGKPMVQWVLDALEGCTSVHRVLISGLESADALVSSKLVGVIDDQGGMLQNMQAAARHYAQLPDSSAHLLVVSADIPGLRAEHVDWVVQTAMQTDMDVYYTVIERRVMEARYPGSKRSYAKLRDLEVCGGDMNVLRKQTLLGNDEIWGRILDARKNVFRQAALIGYGTLLLFMLRRLTLQQAVGRVAGRLHLSGQALVCPYAEVGMDVDKPFQLELMRSDLAGRPAALPVAAG